MAHVPSEHRRMEKGPWPWQADRGLDYWPAKLACSHVRKSGVRAALERRRNITLWWDGSLGMNGRRAVKGDLAMGDSLA